MVAWRIPVYANCPSSSQHTVPAFCGLVIDASDMQVETKAASGSGEYGLERLSCLASESAELHLTLFKWAYAPS